MQINNNRFFNRNSLNYISKWWLDIDKINFLITIGIIIFGLIITANSSPAIAKRIGVDKFFFLKKQIIFASLAFFVLIFFSFLQQGQIKILAVFGIIFSILALIMVLAFGFEIKGARRWLSLGGFVIQPSEFAKTFFVIANAYILYRFEKNYFMLKYAISVSLFVIVSSLFILQPDFGMTVALTILWASQLFVHGISMIFVIICAILAICGAILAYLFLPHVRDRINRFLDLDSVNYQVERSLDAYVNGGFLGKGQGNGVVKNFIPDAHTDFVFAVVAEELGILTCILFLVLLLYFVTRIVKRALEEENMFVYIALFGLMMEFLIQVVVNIGVSLRLLPTKGMTLPFISYGGSSMLSMAICFGLMLALTKRKYHNNIDYGNLKML